MIKDSNFKPAWWLPNGHLQTFWPVISRGRAPLKIQRERLELPDGDFIDLDWAESSSQRRPLVLILHGLGGSADSPYARGMMQALKAQGLRSVVMHFRGCSGDLNRLPQSYHFGDFLLGAAFFLVELFL